MKALYAALTLLPFASFAQTTWTVHVGGSTTGLVDPYYDPPFITIDVGDNVEWVRDNGTHNINGGTDIFPGNPEGFYSGTPQDTSWPFTFTFTIPGFYNYHCSQMGHSATQFGTITVLNPEGVSETNGATAIKLFPVPTSGTLVIDGPGMDLRSAEIFAVDGRRLMSVALNGGSRSELSVEQLAPGHYFLRLEQANGVATIRPFTKE